MHGCDAACLWSNEIRFQSSFISTVLFICLHKAVRWLDDVDCDMNKPSNLTNIEPAFGMENMVSRTRVAHETSWQGQWPFSSKQLPS